MKKKWLIALFKTNEFKRAEVNLLNQNFKFYLPKITTKITNSKPKEEVLFPGYIFVNTSLENYSALRYTIGIIDIIKFGENVAYISSKDIKAMQIVEKASKIDPVVSKMQIGQEATIKEGSFKGNMVKICSLPHKERVDVFLTILGSLRKISISEKVLS
jgi:transcription antitermination factor NusG